MTSRVLRPDDDDDRLVWLKAWQATAAQEPYCHPHFCTMLAAPGVEPRCMIWQDGGREAIFPFVLRDLSVEPWTDDDERRRDVALPVAYNGAYVRNGAPRGESAGEDFWRDFDMWARANDVVCASARISLYRDEILPMNGWTETPACDNIVVDLRIYEQQGIASYARSLRRNVRRAERAGIAPAMEDAPGAFTAFRQLYTETMDRRGATSAYHFSDSFFERLEQQIGSGLTRLFVARDQAGEPVCGEVVLLGRRRAYAFIAGSNHQARRTNAHELLRCFMCSWLAEHGWDEFVLGGGNSPNDSLFQHKLRFASYGRHSYHKGRRIYDPAGYVQLVQQRQSYQASVGLGPHVPRDFPEYR